MAGTEDLRLVRLGAPDVSAALALSTEANWNQTPDDWRLMLKHGQGFGLRSAAGDLVASALALPFGEQFAWISMVLVTRARRHRGLATRLMHHCIEHIEGRGMTPVLDATPAGEPVYSALGFEPVFGITRWHADKPTASVSRHDAVRPLSASDLPDLAKYDAAVFGGDRGFLLDALLRRSGRRGFAADGFVLARDGRRSTQIGPLIAEDPETAIALFRRAIAAEPGSIYVDVLDRHAQFTDLLPSMGFAIERPYTRMRRGGNAAYGDPARTYLIAGPELG